MITIQGLDTLMLNLHLLIYRVLCACKHACWQSSKTRISYEIRKKKRDFSYPFVFSLMDVFHNWKWKESLSWSDVIFRCDYKSLRRSIHGPHLVQVHGPYILGFLLFLTHFRPIGPSDKNWYILEKYFQKGKRREKKNSLFSWQKQQRPEVSLLPYRPPAPLPSRRRLRRRHRFWYSPRSHADLRIEKWGISLRGEMSTWRKPRKNSTAGVF